jgi:hypothetical protein
MSAVAIKRTLFRVRRDIDRFQAPFTALICHSTIANRR